MKKTDLNYLRKDFPIFQKKDSFVYLDHAATSQKPKCVVEKMSDFYLNSYATVHRSLYQLSLEATSHYNQVREKVKKFIGASSSEELIFTKGTTEGINLVATSFGEAFIQEGDEIIVSQMEHHANLVPWQMLAHKKKAKLVILPMTKEGDLDLSILDSLFSEKTRLLAVTHISNSIGTINPIEGIIQKAHEKNVPVLIDGAQSAPHLPLNMEKLDTDFYVFSGHKMYGPTGVGILYAKKKWLEKMPPYQGGGDMIESVSFEKTIYKEPPLKFEAGTPMIAEVIGLGEAIDYIQKIGIETVFSWEYELLSYALDQFQKIEEIKILGNPLKRSSIIQFHIPGIHSFDLGTMLDAKNIAIRTGHHCAEPAVRFFGVSSSCRVSFGLYNTFEEIDQLIKALKELIVLFGVPHAN